MNDEASRLSGPADPPAYEARFDQVLEREHERIAAHRNHPRRRQEPSQPYLGLALGGRGPGAAAFGLGVLQALGKRGLLRKTDFLSTVDDGGMAGASLTWQRDQQAKELKLAGRPLDESVATDMPGEGQSTDAPADGAAFADPDPDPDPALRSPVVASINTWTLFGGALRGLFFATLVYGGLAVGVFFVLSVLDDLVDLVMLVPIALNRSPTLGQLLEALNAGYAAAILLGAILAFLWLISLLGHRLHWPRSAGAEAPQDKAARLYQQGSLMDRRVGRLLGWSLVLALAGTVPQVVDALSPDLEHFWPSLIMGSCLLAVGALLGFSELARFHGHGALGSRSHWRRPLETAAVWAAAILSGYGLLIVACSIALTIKNGPFVHLVYWVFVIALGLGLLINPDRLGTWRRVRDRLLDSFLRAAPGVDPQGHPVLEAAQVPLQDLCGEDTPGPYHLIGVRVNTFASSASRLRSRGSDGLVLAPLYCGGEATGWARTERWLGGRMMTLPTAIALSSASYNPGAPRYASLPGGRTLASLAMGLSGTREGCWIRNPDPTAARTRLPLRPNLLFPGLKQGLLALGMDERRRLIEIAGGGAIDELGIYELLRRRVDLILAADGNLCAGTSLDELAKVVERARIDFGIEIEFDDPRYGLQGLTPYDSDVSQRGFAVARVRYPTTSEQARLGRTGTTKGPAEGRLIYLKASLVDGLTPNVRNDLQAAIQEQLPSGWRASSATAFEAFRMLGHQIAQDAIDQIGLCTSLSSAGDASNPYLDTAAPS